MAEITRIYRCYDVCRVLGITQDCCYSCHYDADHFGMPLIEADELPGVLIEVCCTVSYAIRMDFGVSLWWGNKSFLKMLVARMRDEHVLDFESIATGGGGYRLPWWPGLYFRASEQLLSGVKFKRLFEKEVYSRLEALALRAMREGVVPPIDRAGRDALVTLGETPKPRGLNGD